MEDDPDLGIVAATPDPPRTRGRTMPRSTTPAHDRVSLTTAEVRALAAMAEAEAGPPDRVRSIPLHAGRLSARVRGVARRLRDALPAEGWRRVAVLGSAVLLGALIPVVIVLAVAIVVGLVAVGAAAREHAGAPHPPLLAQPWSRSSRRGEG